MTSFEKKVKRLSGKNWAALRAFWLNHIPELEPRSQVLDETLEQDELLRREVSAVQSDGEYRFEPETSPAPLLFRDSIFVAYKAVRVSCEAARQAADGLPTWSISTAHHSTMFALRALLGLCGVGYLEVGGRHFLVDVQPSERKGQRQRLRGVAGGNEVQLIEVPQMQHREWWKVYQRILNASSAPFGCWPFPVDAKLALCDASMLSRPRNDLHYRLTWFYEDLFERAPIASFGLVEDEAAVNVVEKLEDGEASDATLILNQVLLGNCLGMLEDLSTSSRRVKEVVETINSVVERFTNDIVANWYSRVNPQ